MASFVAVSKSLIVLFAIFQIISAAPYCVPITATGSSFETPTCGGTCFFASGASGWGWFTDGSTGFPQVTTIAAYAGRQALKLNGVYDIGYNITKAPKGSYQLQWYLYVDKLASCQQMPFDTVMAFYVSTPSQSTIIVNGPMKCEAPDPDFQRCHMQVDVSDDDFITIHVKSNLANSCLFAIDAVTMCEEEQELTTSPLTTQPLTTKPLTTQELTTMPLTTQPLTTQPLTTQGLTTQPLTTKELTTQPLTTQPLTTKPLTTMALTTQPLTTKPLTTQDPTTQPLTTKPLTTQELTTQPLTTQPLTTKPLTTQPLTTKPLTTQELTTQPLTTQALTTKPLTTQDPTTQVLTMQPTTKALTTKPLTTQELTTQLPTTKPLTTNSLTTQPLTTKPLTTQQIQLTTSEMTTKPLTTQPLTTQALTTQALTTQALTTQELTTQPLTTNSLTTAPASTGGLTTSPLTTKSLTTRTLTTRPVSTSRMTTGFAVVSTTGGTTDVEEDVGIDVIQHPNCTLCGTEYYLCSDEEGWGDGSFLVSNPIFEDPDSFISTAHMSFTQLKFCNPGVTNRSMEVRMETHLITSLSTEEEGGCQCGSNCTDINNAETFPLPGIDNVHTKEKLVVTISSAEKLCIRQMSITFAVKRNEDQTQLPQDSDGNDKFPRGAIAAIVIAGAACIVLPIGAAALGRRRKRLREQNEEKTVPQSSLELDQVYVEGNAALVGTPNKDISFGNELLASPDASWRIPYDQLDISKELGRGTFGVVYLAKWRSSKVAVKQLLILEELSQKQFDDFIKEAYLLSKLRPHANIVQFQGACLELDRPLCIVTEFMDKGDLWSYLESTAKIDRYLINRFVSGIAAGMRHLHMEGITHRDLAARNVLLSADLTPKISDFGMSRLNEKEETNVTVSTVGPLKWMSPELLLYREYGPKSDVWSFGIVLVEILTRDKPYPQLNPAETASKVAAQQIRPTLPDTTDPKILEVFEGCLKWEAVDRMDANQICDILGKLETQPKESQE